MQVLVSEGILEGDKIDNKYGDPFYSFKGIPYAEPPVGDLRFQPPQPAKPWTGVRSAKEFGPISHQYNPLVPLGTNQNEDCLYLNVYAPNVKPEGTLPVMVWIHGGGFIWGSGNDDCYGPEFIIRNNVILVTFNYRLLVLGFLCLDTPEVPGNAGMKDQVAALKWVKQNISSFGGDPENVTIFGESAGAASVGYHLISPMSKGLFRRAILQSGAATCWWSQAFVPREKSICLAKSLGFHSEDDQELYEFFKSQPPENLRFCKLVVSSIEKPYACHYGVANEKDFGQERFFYGDVADVLRNGINSDVEVLTGYNQNEGLMTLCIAQNSMEEMISYFSNLEMLTPYAMKFGCVISDQLKVARELRKSYLAKTVITEENCEELLKFLNMDMFTHSVVLSGKILSKTNTVYMYKLRCVSERNMMARHLGVENVVGRKAVSHMDDIPYLFPMKILEQNIELRSDTFELINRTTKLWTNFAKYGNPTPDETLGIRWQPYTIDNEDYLEIGNELICRRSPDKEEFDLWNSLFNEYLPKYSL